MSIAVQTPTPRRADEDGSSSPLVSVVIPCLNESENIEACVLAALEAIVEMGVEGEVVVADNDSEDDSAHLAGWIADAPSQKPGAIMTRMKPPLTDADIAALVAYLQSLK